MKAEKDLVDDALHATRAAAKEGYVPGGGVALLRTQDAIFSAAKKAKGDEKIGFDIVAHAVESIVANPKMVPPVLREVGESYLNFQVVAKREQEQRTELAKLPEVVATVPYFDSDIYDMGGLLDLGFQIWGKHD